MSFLQFNEITGEPFIRLKDHSHIIVTPPRPSDRDRMVEILNDERVYPWLTSVPFPYTPDDANWWINHQTELSKEVLEQLRKASPSDLVVNCPVQFIREVQDDGTDLFIGTIDLVRIPWMDITPIVDENSDLEALLEENTARPVGDPDIFWSAGYYLAPSHFGKGIMPDALGTLLDKWFIPRMGVTKIVGSAYAGNPGSTKVFLKNGFVYRKQYKAIRKGRDGTMYDLDVLDWNIDNHSSK